MNHDDYEREIYPEFYPSPRADAPLPEKPALPEISVRLRAWRDKRSVRVCAPMLTAWLGERATISNFCNVESGHLERVDSQTLADIEEFLDDMDEDDNFELSYGDEYD